MQPTATSADITLPLTPEAHRLYWLERVAEAAREYLDASAAGVSVFSTARRRNLLYALDSLVWAESATENAFMSAVTPGAACHPGPEGPVDCWESELRRALAAQHGEVHGPDTQTARAGTSPHHDPASDSFELEHGDQADTPWYAATFPPGSEWRSLPAGNPENRGAHANPGAAASGGAQ